MRRWRRRLWSARQGPGGAEGLDGKLYSSTLVGGWRHQWRQLQLGDPATNGRPWVAPIDWHDTAPAWRCTKACVCIARLAGEGAEKRNHAADRHGRYERRSTTARSMCRRSCGTTQTYNCFRGVPYHAESSISSAQVPNCFSPTAHHILPLATAGRWPTRNEVYSWTACPCALAAGVHSLQ